MDDLEARTELFVKGIEIGINIEKKVFIRHIDEMIEHLKKLRDPKDEIDPLKDYHCYDVAINTLNKLKDKY